MSLQKLSSEHWEVWFPEDWIYKDQGIEHTTYFEAPDHAEGIYVSAWRDPNKPLLAAMRDVIVIERRSLQRYQEGEWELTGASEEEGEAQIDSRTEYFHALAGYRIASRVLGRADYFVRLTYHDYDCADPRVSADKSE